AAAANTDEHELTQVGVPFGDLSRNATHTSGDFVCAEDGPHERLAIMLAGFGAVLCASVTLRVPRGGAAVEHVPIGTAWRFVALALALATLNHTEFGALDAIGATLVVARHSAFDLAQLDLQVPAPQRRGWSRAQQPASVHPPERRKGAHSASGRRDN